jgi:uncharacterized RDD family membrane protein YckC
MDEDITPTLEESASVTPLRRLAAAFYDLILVASVVFLGAGIAVAVVGDAVQSGTVWFQVYLVTLMYAYFVGFWCRAGYTPGMRPWRVRVESANGRRIHVTEASLRFAYGWISLLACGVGFLWAFVDSNKLMWHDRWSGTRIVRDESLYKT